ncbi:putative membrane protein [Yokenella regensburgei ATCC 43003]|nr:putative membrane protein [Yokenella regensburgei ATCC 43003]
MFSGPYGALPTTTTTRTTTTAALRAVFSRVDIGMEVFIRDLLLKSSVEFIQTQLYGADNGIIFICAKMRQRSQFNQERIKTNIPPTLCYGCMTIPAATDAMTLTLFAILLFAALLHASWNAIVKAGNDKLYAAVSVSGSAAVMALLALPFSPQPSVESIPFLIASCILQVIYTVLVAKTYQVSDMSQTYPLMRGTAPLLVAVISVAFMGEMLSEMAWLGICVICLAILGMALNGRSSSRKGIYLALLNACFIAAYTLVDGTGVRVSGTAIGYTLWTFFMNGFCLLCWALLARRKPAISYLSQHWRKGIFGGIATMGAYGLALWAMTQAPLAVVAALRETSILFGALIAFILLKERVSGIRAVAACGIAAGAILLRLA